MAAARANLEWISSEVRKGTHRDAILYSVGTNSAHGLPRTNADKRHAVMLLLNDEEWATWTNAEIARRCCVDSSTVDKYRKEMSLPVSGSEPTTKTYTTKHGTVATMRTENIGRASAQAQPDGPVRRSAEARADEIRRMVAVAASAPFFCRLRWKPVVAFGREKPLRASNGKGLSGLTARPKLAPKVSGSYHWKRVETLARRMALDVPGRRGLLRLRSPPLRRRA